MQKESRVPLMSLVWITKGILIVVWGFLLLCTLSQATEDWTGHTHTHTQIIRKTSQHQGLIFFFLVINNLSLRHNIELVVGKNPAEKLAHMYNIAEQTEEKMMRWGLSGSPAPLNPLSVCFSPSSSLVSLSGGQVGVSQTVGALCTSTCAVPHTFHLHMHAPC